jgi:transcriptional regulator with XRE-family HTH domain
LSINLVHSPHEAADSELATGDGREMYLIDASHKNVNEQIASRITLLRQAHGMSFADFAHALGITVRRLKHIEQGRAPISLELLLNICRRFRKPREYFFASTLIQRPFACVLRSTEIGSAGGESCRNGHDVAGCFASAAIKPLAAKFPSRGMHPYLVRLHRKRRRPMRMRPHHGQEFVYVLKGSVKLHTRRDGHQYEETLYPGDSCFVDATAPHQFSDANFHPYDRGGSELVAVFWNPRKGS